jgi:energy-coupling factor transport system substrate-specific component
MSREQNKSRPEERTPWISQISSRQVIYGLVGAVLYAFLYWITSRFPIPALGSVILRPAVAILVFFGLAYGPLAGLLAGFIGNAFGDALSSGDFYWNWSLGYALIGVIAGLFMIKSTDFGKGRNILKAILAGTLAIAVGMMFASLGEILRSGIDLGTAMSEYFPVAFLGNFPSVIVLLPIFMILFAAVVSRRDR